MRMPVRSGVCTYSPTTTTSISNSKYLSTVLPSSGSLSVGSYKPLSSNNSNNNNNNRPPPYYYPSSTLTHHHQFSSSSLADESSTGASYGFSSNRYSSSSSTSTSNSSTASSTYNPHSPYSSLTSSTSSAYSPVLASSSFTSTGLYRPLNSSTQNSFSSAQRHYQSPSRSSLLPARSSYNAHSYTPKYSSASSASSSLNSSASLINDTNYDINNSSSGYSSTLSNYQHILVSPTSTRHYTTLTSQSSPAEPLPAEVPQGLVNLGNTCYMNAVIQSLYSIELFRNFIFRTPHDKLLTSELSSLFKMMKNSTCPVNPSQLKQTFSRLQSKFSGVGQQDAQEFLRYLVNSIHEEFNQATRRPRRTVPPKAPRNAQEAWLQYREIVDDSPLVDIVVGQLCSTIICSVCSNKSYCWDPFWDLSLPLTRGKSVCRLSDVIHDFQAREILDSDERPVCCNCKKPTRSSKQIELSHLPQVLILHLKKFTNDGYKMTTPEIKIDNTLHLNSCGTSYSLAACISHHGHSSSSGHYTSHCRYSSRWFHFNDEKIKDVTSSFDSSKLNDAYVLFYKQSPTASPSSLHTQTKL